MNSILKRLMISEPMKYWSLPLRASTTQRAKLANILENNTDYLVSVKVDGAHYRLFRGDNDEVALLSRTVSAVSGTFVDKIENLGWLKAWAQQLPSNTVLVGEVFVGSLVGSEAKEVVSVMGCKPQTSAIRQQTTPVGYFVFDVLAWDGQDLSLLPNQARLEYLKLVAPLSGASKEREESQGLVRVAEFTVPKNIYETLDKVLGKGGEGLVLIKKNGKYKSGRSAAWDTIKLKKELHTTVDVVVTGVVAATRETASGNLDGWQYWEDLKTGDLVFGIQNKAMQAQLVAVSKAYWNGWIGAVEVGVYDDNDTLVGLGTISSGLTDELRALGSALVGEVFEVSAMDFDTVSKRFRHARLLGLRTGPNAKAPTDCRYCQLVGEVI